MQEWDEFTKAVTPKEQTYWLNLVYPSILLLDLGLFFVHLIELLIHTDFVNL